MVPDHWAVFCCLGLLRWGRKWRVRAHPHSWYVNAVPRKRANHIDKHDPQVNKSRANILLLTLQNTNESNTGVKQQPC